MFSIDFFSFLSQGLFFLKIMQFKDVSMILTISLDKPFCLLVSNLRVVYCHNLNNDP